MTSHSNIGYVYHVTPAGIKHILTTNNYIRFQEPDEDEDELPCGYCPEESELKRIWLDALLNGYNEDHIFKDDRDRDLRIRYMKEPWARLLAAMGRDPIHTESSARYVAEFACSNLLDPKMIAVIWRKP